MDEDGRRAAREPSTTPEPEAPLPTLRTPRLVLRPPSAADLAPLFAIYGDPEVMRHASDPPAAGVDAMPALLASMATMASDGTSFEWVVVRRDDGAVVGTCGLHGFDGAGGAEVGCLLARAAWGLGLAREAVSALVEHAGRDRGLRRLRADIDPRNARSRRLFAALGFESAGGTLHERALPAGGATSPR